MAAVPALARLAGAVTVRHWLLGFNQLDGAGMAAVAAALLANHPQHAAFETLNLEHNPLGDDGCGCGHARWTFFDRYAM